MAPHATLQHLRTEVDVVFDPLALAALTTPGAGAEFYTAWARTVYPHLALPSDWDLKDESGRLGWLNGVATQGDSYLRRRLAGATQVLAVLRQAETVLAGPPATQDKRTEDLGKKLLKAARKGESHGDLYAFAALAAMPSVQPHVYAAMQLRVTRADKDTTVSIGGPGAAFQPPVESGSAFTQ